MLKIMNRFPLNLSFRSHRTCKLIASAVILLMCCQACAPEQETIEPFDMAGHSRTLAVNDLEFPVTVYGEGPDVVFLHGFPDSREVWRYQVLAVADAGYRVIVPDQRGFGGASRPDGVEHYDIQALAADIIGIMDQLGIDRARLVGHDFGAGLAWFMAAHIPERFSQLVVMSVGSSGNPGWDTMEQREASWYFDFFNKTGIAETALTANDWDFFRRLTRHSGDQEHFIRDLSRPGALTAALNWYRANTRGWGGLHSGLNYPLIDMPVMGIWSSADPFLKEAQMQNSGINVAGPWRYERIEDAGHWFMLEKPAAVNRLLLDFFNSH